MMSNYSCQHRQFTAIVISTVVLTVLSIPTTLAWVQPTGLISTNNDVYQRERLRQQTLLFDSSQNEGDEEAKLPFFARALQKIRKKDSIAKEDTTQIVLLDRNEDSAEELKPVVSESDQLRALADKTRLEAQKMELMLTLSKIEKLELKLLSFNGAQTKQDADMRSEILAETQSLMRKLNPQQVDTQKIPDSQQIIKEEGSSMMPEPAEVLKQIQNEQIPVLSDEKRDEAIAGFEKLPQQIKDMMAKSVGMKDGKNATAVVEKLMDENRLFEGDDDEQFSLVAKTEDFEDIFIDMNIAEVNAFVRNILPEVTRKDGVKKEDIDVLYSDVLGKDVFNPNGKPENVPGGFIIRGVGKVKPIDGKDYGDVLIDALDKKMATSSLAGKVQIYYILDPTPPSGEDIMNEEDETPLLLVTNADISPTTGALVKPTVTFTALASITIFALGSFSFNEDLMNQLSDTEGFGGLYELSLPLALAVLSTQIAHEAGHLIFALKDGIGIGLPTLIPGIQFGLTGSITPITSSPKNIKALFDFSVAGPLAGLFASFVLLYNGLELTAFMDLAAREQLPAIPVEILRISALGGGAIEYLLASDGILNSPNPTTDLIKLHPFAIAGFGGLITNALSLLPIGNTDGGRISVAFFGRKPEVPCRNEVDELDSTRGFVAIATSFLVLLILTPLA
ncbi:hypothetical protein ACHAWC_010442 [Mediolabrus comicus]